MNLKLKYNFNNIFKLEAVCYETKKGFKRRPYRKSITKTLLLDTPDHDLFLDFLQRLLRWDPIERMSAVDALNHPWITGDLKDFSKLPREKPLISP
jgi:serine/threonine protein kinase